MKKLACCWLLLVQVVCYGQDFMLTAESGPMTSVLYEPIVHEFTIQNTGIVDVPYFHFSLILSADDQYSSDDFSDIEYVYPGLKAGESKKIEVSARTLNRPLPGTYRMLVLIDPANEVKETDEGNNTFLLPASYIVGPSDIDFAFESFTLDKSTYAQNEIIAPSFVIKNYGTTTVSFPMLTSFYLSTDATLDAADILFHQEFVADVKSKTIVSNPTFTLSLPATAAGNYNVIALTGRSYSGRYAETNENNNSVAVPITIMPSDVDLEIVSIKNPSYRVTYSRLLEGDLTIRNNGTTGVTGYVIGGGFAYYSGYPDEMVADGVKQDGADSYLAPGQSKVIHVTLEVNRRTVISRWGDWHLAFSVNPGKAILETNYENNVTKTTELFDVEPFPIESTSVREFASVGTPSDVDTEVSFQFSMENIGLFYHSTLPFRFQFTDEKNNKVFQKDVSIPVGNPGTITNSVVPFAMDFPLPAGTYTVTMYTTYSEWFLSPYNPSAQLVIQPKRYALTGTVTGEDGTPITKGKIFLYEKAASGAITFTQQAKLDGNNSFALSMGKLPATLYVVPDSSVFKGYVPTLYGKTFMLTENSFFSATGAMNLAVEVLKIQSPGVGAGVINGRVRADVSSGRSGDSTSPLGFTETYYRVILLSASEQVVGYAVTDALGNFEFKNLPRAKYKLYLSRLLDQPQMKSPLVVDISERNITANFTVGNTITFDTKTLLLSQTIVFDALPELRYGSAPLTPKATTSSELPVVFVSSDATIAEIRNGQIIANHTGKVSITATQPGDAFFAAAQETKQTLTILKGSQTITFPEIIGTPEHNSSFALVATTTSGLPLIYSSDNENVATLFENIITIHMPGEANITATQPGNENYDAATPVTRNVSAGRVVGIENPLGGISIYPNPVQNLLNIEHATSVDAVQILNAMGGTTLATRWNGEQLDLSNVPSGIYFLKLYSGSSFSVFKIVKE